MPLEEFFENLSSDLPVLFAYIGWAAKYDGTKRPVGNHRALESSDPAEVMESEAFVPGSVGLFRCGIGGGGVGVARFHVVFVALDPGSGQKKIVGLYANAEAEADDLYAFALARNVALIPPEKRPVVENWDDGQSMRRWASHPSRRSHPELLIEFEMLRVKLPSLLALSPELIDGDQTFSGMEATEGRVREGLVKHRTREAKLRDAKLAAALQANGGRLRCEVPGCGFDFFEKYGKIGERFALVHHRESLSLADDEGRTTRSLSEID